MMRMPNPCNPRDCPLYASGWCEYDFATGQIMPMDEENCPLMEDKLNESQSSLPVVRI